MNKKSKILLVSYLFAPNNAIGAIRPSKIAERLIKLGYDVDVFTYGYTDNDSYDITDVEFNKYLVNDKKVPQKEIKSSSGGVQLDKGLVYKLKRHYVTYLSSKTNALFLEKFKQVYDTTLCNNNYDVIFTSFGPLASLKAGLYVKKRNPKIKWICDFRDPVLVDVTPELYRPYFKYIQEKACRKADVIVAVSNGYLNRICKGRYNDKSYMIPNGYDLKDKPLTNFNVNKDVLILTYVGALYSGKRDLSPVFKAVKELVDENKISERKIVFEYAGTDFSVAKMQAEKYGMGNILHDNGRLTRKDCLNLQTSSHALVLSTWNKKGEEGVFPGKFLEYMLIDRPIISVVDGDLKNSEVSQVVKAGNFGVSYEVANKGEDFKTLKEYIYNLYTQIVEEGIFNYAPERSVLDRYDYDNIMKEIEMLL